VPASSKSLVIAITGGSAGIGRATALRVARNGARVAICGRRQDRLDQVAHDIQTAGGEALAFPADVAIEQDMHSFLQATIDRFGRVDAVVCNAGFGIYGALDAIDAAGLRRLMDVNYLGTCFAIRSALPHFRAHGRGHIVVVSSIAGRRGIPFMGAYSATKFAQTGLVECLRAELRGSGIHVTGVYPVSTDTEFFDVMTEASGFATAAHGPRQSADAVADAIARVLDHPRAEVFPLRKARGLVWLNAIAPAFCDRIVKRWGRTPIAP